jgi:hypothetical protein
MVIQRKLINREKLALDYRAGIKSLRMLATEYGFSAPRITQIAKEEGWTRDLSERIREASAAKLNRSILNEKLNAKTPIAECEGVEAYVEMQAGIVQSHRNHITCSRSIMTAFIEELDSITRSRALFERLGERMRSEDDKSADKLNKLYRKIVSLPSRVDTIKKLVDSLKPLVALEHEVFGIDGNKTPRKTLDEALDSLADHN